jgi:predicted TIM-barrel fold metal-dependent hydrolase
VKNGFKVIDMDTHVNAPGDLLEKYADPSFVRDRYEELKPVHKNRNPGTPNEVFDISTAPIPFGRVAGEPYLPEHDTPVPGGGRGTVRFSTPKNALGLPAHHRQAVRPGADCLDSQNRLLDMDDEGRDIDFMFPGAWVASVQRMGDPTLSEGVYRAFHRFLSDYCSSDPDRIKSQAQLPANDVEWSIAELKSLAKEKWLAGAWVHLPANMPIDDPSLEPLWATMSDLGVPLVHHSFYVDWPYFPGAQDLWGNSVMARTAAHPWGAQRLVTYLIISGIFDRHPNLNCAVAEVGHGWLPHWAIRLTEQVYYVQGVTQPLKYRPIEYIQQGRFRASAEPMEGPEMTKACYDILGNGALMHQSDYPHPEAYFPDTAEMIIDWPIWKDLGDDSLRHHMSANAEQLLRMA